VEGVQLVSRVTTTVECALDPVDCVIKQVIAFQAIYGQTQLTQAERLSTTTFQILESHGLELSLLQLALEEYFQFLRIIWSILHTSKTLIS
jgi:hypothetical protein